MCPDHRNYDVKLATELATSPGVSKEQLKHNEICTALSMVFFIWLTTFEV